MSNVKLLIRAIRYKFNSLRDNRGSDTRDFTREKVLSLFRIFNHPIDTFSDLKFENKASVTISLILLALFFLTRLLDANLTALLFNNGNQENVLVDSFVYTVGLVIVWVVCNWATCTLANGEGTFGNIWIATTYSVLPYCLMTWLSIGLSYMLSVDESVMFTTLRGIGVLWSMILLFLGMMISHQYTVLKTIVSVFLTMVMIVFCIFLIVIIYSIILQMWDFGFSVFLEIMSQV